MDISLRETYLWLSSIGLSNKEIEKVESCLDDIREVFSSKTLPEKLFDTLSKTSIEKISENKNKEYILKVIDNLNNLNVNYYCVLDEDYPKRLRRIENSPKIIYIRGEIKEEDDLSIGIVGSRKHTEYGKWVCKYFTQELVKLGVTIISGMAYGIDAIAHKTTLDLGGRTFAVLGNGVDIVYPINNTKIYMNTINSGAVISEYPLGAKSLPYRFPERNRIISGMSLGVLVIEASEKSGSLITARVAAEQGKEVFAVPGNINNIYSKGTNQLIRDGAIPLLDVDDILLNIAEIKNNNDKNEEEFINLNFEEKEIFDLMVDGFLNSTIICEKTKKNISQINSILTSLELKGLVENISADEFIVL